MSRLRFVEDTGSTNTDLLADFDAMEGDWLIARRQRSGRGRQGRDWHSLDGNFFGSTIVCLRRDDPEAPTLSLVAGLALIDAIHAAAPAAPVSLKWPNDVMRGKGKLGGILLERAGDRVVAGFGVNLAVEPGIEGRETASLSDMPISVEAFAPLLAGAFARLLGAWRIAEPASLARSWEEKAHPKGTPIMVHQNPDEVVQGLFDGIETDGALRLRLADGSVTIIRAGDVGLA
ncbi:biotin--[acetyl-CoA-carboxylase] ligase [Sphingomonas sp. HDW15A]|uniref:biotin--[acetyl-CoA-carboxylase] ligase n=1 Tax=Sphingomonas sp. HDW15A TaxID=2714942 RepID=UPI00140C8694|nr:biotin--[acetyl-CoA-carboxylase] ligase [Sphingomonas sp. HDW15A]QIK95729.1 biotin--[acetyl-CoA-carboxylase] ligase [Sphingomonas sp. HDW15A]